jgi:hypothetical protein
MLGFIILASMLFISGAISIFELTKLGKAVKGLIYDNYRSIDYSRNMLDALEEHENALLLFAEGDSELALERFRNAEIMFNDNLDSASINLTLTNELAFIDSVNFYYSILIEKTRAAFQSNDFSLGFYLKEINPIINTTSQHVKNLITINQQGLFKSAAFLETSAQRASVPGLIVIITSLIFTFVFTYLVHHYFVSPILRLTKGINDYVKYRKAFEVQMETKDELYSLKESIVNLISILKSSNRKLE